jgi:hypothetical protein
MRLAMTVFAVVLVAAAGTAYAAKGTRFWNLTHAEIDSLELAPAGTDNYGENLCLQDDDKSVEASERLQVTGVKSGTYDIKIHDVNGRSCSAKNITVEDGKVFSVSEKELVDCRE